MQVRTEHQVYQSNFPELFERLENLTFEGDITVELDGVVYNVARDTDTKGEFHLLRAEG
jgi:hypothetical protein